MTTTFKCLASEAVIYLGAKSIANKARMKTTLAGLGVVNVILITGWVLLKLHAG